VNSASVVVPTAPIVVPAPPVTSVTPISTPIPPIRTSVIAHVVTDVSALAGGSGSNALAARPSPTLAITRRSHHVIAVTFLVTTRKFARALRRWLAAFEDRLGSIVMIPVVIISYRFSRRHLRPLGLNRDTDRFIEEDLLRTVVVIIAIVITIIV
jgi:hypothetical protein